MSRMGEHAAENPPPDTDLEDCAYAQFERELQADPAYLFWLAHFAAGAANETEVNHGDQCN